MYTVQGVRPCGAGGKGNKSLTSSLLLLGCRRKQTKQSYEPAPTGMPGVIEKLCERVELKTYTDESDSISTGTGSGLIYVFLHFCAYVRLCHCPAP